VVTHHFS